MHSVHGVNSWLCSTATPERARRAVQRLQHLQVPPPWVASGAILSWQLVKALAGRGCCPLKGEAACTSASLDYA